jgi:hypothetical protein
MKIALLASAAALLIANAAIAAPPAPSTPAAAAAAKPAEATQAAPAADTSGVSDADVQKVAMVGAAVQKLTTDTKDPDALSKQEGAILSDQAITFDRYNEVANKAQTNPALAARLAKAKPADSALNAAIQTAKAETAGPAPSATPAAAAPATESTAPSATSNLSPASANAVDPKTSPVDPTLGFPVPPPGVNDLK